MRISSVVAATVVLSACTVQKTASSAATDSAAAKDSSMAKGATPLPAPAPAPNPPFTSKDLETTNPKPAKKPAKKPTAGGEYDSVLDPVLYIGPDGKIHRLKR